MQSSPERNPELPSVLRNAVRLAMASGAAVSGIGHGDPAQAQTTADSSASPELQEVVVTGSRIRRPVDEATASPVTTVDQTTIQESGIQTAGDLLQSLPNISGNATNPGLNNGGGFGESNIELRGLNAKRTLILLNGRRIGLVGSTSGNDSGDAVDVNEIPVNLIDHVDVLKEGAGAVYGSDAIAGVVNFITKKGVNDLEINADYGRTTHGDGPHESVNALWGGSTDKLDFIIGGSYFKQKAVYAADRPYSRNALYLYSGSTKNGGPSRYLVAAGSSRVPTGKVYLPAGDPLLTQLGCSHNYVTRVPGTDGTQRTTADYQCLTYSFNYQPYNLIMTPQERGAIFSTATYKITDDLEAYAEVLVNHTHSGFEEAPLPFDATADNVIISAQNEFNPFGLDFGGVTTTNNNYRTRFVTLGDRIAASSTDSRIVHGGLRGKLPINDWQWELSLSDNRLDQAQQVYGYVYFPGLQNAVGPSFQDGSGWHCGTSAASEVAGCTPINFFDLDSPQTISQLKALGTSYHAEDQYVFQNATIDFNGKIVSLPAGDLQGAIGFEFDKQSISYTADYTVQAQPPLYTNCLISEEACTGNTSGFYDSKAVYGEVLVPILKDLPGVYSLNFDAGVRYSNYSLFGGNTKPQFKVEYKPISDLLIRSTYAQVYRVPTLRDLYAAPLNNSANYADPCYGYTGAANLSKVCAGAATDGSYSYQGTSQVTAVVLSNPNLKPESGNVWTLGFVWQVPGVQNLALSVEGWRYDIQNLITQLDPNYTSKECELTGLSEFCGLIHRFAVGANQGQIQVFDQPIVNLGELKTDGVDIDIKWSSASTPVGTFRVNLDTSYLHKYESIPVAGATPVEIAGTFDAQFGNYARWRATGQFGWNLGAWDALLQLRYIDALLAHNPYIPSAGRLGQPQPDLEIPRIGYADLTVGYTVKATKTKFQLGMQNITNRQPPFIPQSLVVNADTDVSTYDLLGRRFFVSISQKF